MLSKHIALVADPDSQIPSTDLAPVAAALQKQVTRDLGPIWTISATVDAFPTLDDVPLGYWPILITTENLGDAAGVHLDQDGQPYALVEYGSTWSLTASHECLEMLVDPFGNRLVAGQSPEPAQGRVTFLVEVCDPCEDAQFAYTVNDILVSDFYTPDYFEPVSISVPQRKTTRYSFNDQITQPREVLKGGYLSWKNPTDGSWWQRTFFGDAPANGQIEAMKPRGSQSLREWINNHTPRHLEQLKLPEGHTTLQRVRVHQKSSQTASKLSARRLREQIRRLRLGASEGTT